MGLFTRLFKETPEVKVPSLGVEYGDTGTTMYNGMISGEEYNSELTGTSKYTQYDKMRKGDATVSASLKVIKLPLRAARWFVNPAGDDPVQLEQAKFVEHNIKEAMELTWDDFLREALLMLDYGVFVFEKVFGYVEYQGKTYIGFKKFAPRHPRTINAWKMKDGKRDGITQVTNSKGTIEIPIEKLLIFTNEKEGDNWEGISILRSAYKSWFFKDTFEQIDAMAFERQGLGVPYVKLPTGYKDTDRAKAIEIAKNLRANEKAYVVYPEGYEVGFLDMKGKNTRDPKSSIEYHNRQIVLNVLAQFLMLGSGGGGGSYALSEDQSDFFYDSLQAIANNIKDVVNKYAIKQICDINWPGTKEYPTLEVDEIGVIDKQAFASAINTLVGANLIKPDDDILKHIRKEMDLPDEAELDEDDEETNRLITELELLSVDVVGEGQEMNVDPEMASAMSEEYDKDIRQFNEALKDELMFKAPVSEETKKNISQGLKDYWASKGHSAEIETIEKTGNAISDAKRRIDELKVVVESYKTKASGIKDKKVKNAFNKSVKSKIDEIKAMIKAGRDGIKAEKAKQKEAKDTVKKSIKERKAELRKTRMEKRIEKDQLRIEKLQDQLDQTDDKDKRESVRERIEEVRELIKSRKEDLEEMNNSLFNEESQKKNLRMLSESFKPYRAYTFAEKKVNFGNLKKEMDAKEAEFQRLLSKALTEEKSALLKKFEKAIKEKNYLALQNISLSYTGKYQGEIYEKMKELYNFGENTAASEMKVKPPKMPKEEIQRLKAQSTIIAADHELRVMTKTKIAAIDNISKGTEVKKAIGRVSKVMDTTIKDLSQKTASILASGSINDGRRLTQKTYKNDIHGLQRSELLDNKTCNFCMSLDGRVFHVDDEFTNENQFHTNCRGIWVEILKDEKELPSIDGAPQSILDRYDSINDFQQLKMPKITKDSVASDFVKEEYEKEISNRESKIAKYEKDGTYPNRVEIHKKAVKDMQKMLNNLE